MNKLEIYVSTDIETDGPIPGPYSMLSLASVAINAQGEELARFSANVQTLPGASAHAQTAKWWATQPEAWQACQQNAQPAAMVMADYLAWLKALPGTPVFVAYPSGFDFTFVYWYLLRFTGESPFAQHALDIRSFAMAHLGADFCNSGKRHLPKTWFGQLPHTHVAQDDAKAQAELFANLLRDNRCSRRVPLAQGNAWSQPAFAAAYRFAAQAHAGQTLPGSDLPYLVHLTLVTSEVMAALQSDRRPWQADLAIQCALLHDVIEDTAVTHSQVAQHFGQAVADGVAALSKNPQLERSAQMADSLRRIRLQPHEVWLVKLADRITNLQPPYPPHWDTERLQRYRDEAKTIHTALAGAHQGLADKLAACL